MSGDTLRVRTRFAPSPTGYMHLGNLRTALYAFLIARRAGGDFILRIEDTDREREVPGAKELIFRTLSDAGLNYDEGPDIGGPCGPYIQSEREGLYREYAELLLSRGAAYRCFCGKADKLDTPSKYDGRCLKLTDAEIEARLARKESYVIRQKMPREGVTGFSDLVYGEISVLNEELEDQVLLKSDNMPTYNFANVVDDHLMGITHVVRGSEYLSSTPKYILLYEAFGWDVPVYVHCAPVMKNATEKLSKRRGDPSYEDLLDMGYLKEALLNYIALLGWSPGGEREIFSLGELVRVFDIGGISKSPAIFDMAKLNHINGEYIRAMDPDRFFEVILPELKKAVKRADFNFRSLSELLQIRLERLSEISESVDFFDKLPEYDAEMYVHKKMKTDKELSLRVLKEIGPVLGGIADWTRESVHDALFKYIADRGMKNGAVLWPLRTALSGKEKTPGGGVEIAFLLGKDEVLRRLEIGIKKLEGETGGVS